MGELNMDGTSAWNSNWAWSVPLIVLTVLIHLIGLGLFNVKMVQVLTVVKDRRYFIYAFALGIGITTIWAIIARDRSRHRGSRLPASRSLAR